MGGYLVSWVLRTAVLSAWLLGVGLLAIGLECQRIRVGHRIHNLLHQREALQERVRRLEIRYNRMLSPDLLVRELPGSFSPDRRLSALGEARTRS